MPKKGKMNTEQETIEILNPFSAEMSGYGFFDGKSFISVYPYAFSVYPDMTDPEVAKGVCHDLLKSKQQFKQCPFNHGRSQGGKTI